MAMTCGPENLVEAMTAIQFDQTAPQHVDALSQPGAAQCTPQVSPRSMPPPPNPPFIFPARSSPSISSTPSSYARTTGRRPRSAVETSDGRFTLGDDSDSSSTKSPSLPAFSFNPGASLAPDAMLSPPLSPQSPRIIPARPHGHGHRRGGSEYVGGSIRGGDAIAVIGTSPTKAESGLASPGLPPPRPAGRRGHAHRRSAALSSHDLSVIMHPTTNQAPPLPDKPILSDSAGASDTPSPREPEKKVEDEASVNGALATEDDSQVHPPSIPKSAPRAPRVGFSDNVEIIPRPLSLISSDTSSTITGKPGHSVSGSISSIVSGPPSAPLEADPAPLLTRSASRTLHDSRPSTAGPILEGIQTDGEQIESQSPKRRNSIPTLSLAGNSSGDGPSQPSPTKTPKRWSFFGLEPFMGASSPRGSRPTSSSSAASSGRDSSIIASTDNVAEAVSSMNEEETAKCHTKKSGRRQKKTVKAWAGSILIRRGKTKPMKAKVVVSTSNSEPATAPAEFREEEINTDIATPTTSTPPMPVVMVTGSPSANEAEEGKPRPVTDDEGSYPVIDLDAALGPFNTPLPFNPEWEAAQRAGAQPKRKLHSAAGMSHFSGPGGHYHRRAESAPEMAPFEGGRFGIHRFGSSSTMADVFEEDEEDEDSASKTKTDTLVVDELIAPEMDDKEHIEKSDSKSNDGAASISLANPELIDGDGTDSESRAACTSVMEDAPVPQSMAPDATILEFSGPAPRDHSDNAEDSPRRIVPIREIGPVDVSLQLPSASLTPASPFSMTHSSSFPSPRSPMSYEANRVSTAPSSIADDNAFHSLLMGEPGPEVRYSVDADIPSLTSSNSTMTKDSFGHHPRSSHGNLPGQRPNSFSSAAFGRRRSSLASLSRLISSSHGERSKLSMEVTCDSEPEKKTKHSKAKRFSRKLQFWKAAKDSAPTAS